MLYSVKDLKKVYSDIEGAEEALNKAERLRQENPLVHAGAEMLRRDSTKDELEELIALLRLLITARLDKDTSLRS